MSKIADALVAEMLGQLLFKKELKTEDGKSLKQTKVDRVLAKYLEQTLIKKEERKEEKKEQHRHMGFLEQLILVAIGTYFFGLLQLIALHAFFK